MALTAAWQLALAMGGKPFIETTADRNVRVQILLPLLATSSLFPKNETGQASVATNGESSQPADSSRVAIAGNGHGNGTEVHQAMTPAIGFSFEGS